MARELLVHAGATGERLDVFLARRLAERSRRQIQKLIKNGRVTLNGKVVSAHHLVKERDRIVIDDAVELNPQPAVASAPKPTILFENESVLVIDKPAGLTVHPGPGVRGPTLVDWVRERAPGIVTVGDNPEQRPGIVHRLDRDVSGVMVIAKTQASFENLKRQFKHRTVKKEYLALVHGVPRQRAGTIDFKIERSRRQNGRMTARPPHGQGRAARTHFVVEKTMKHSALLRLRLETGRTHQIRVHLKALGHPIVGDAVYTTKPHRRKAPGLRRPFLHAVRLRFVDLHGVARDFSAPLPADLKAFAPV